MPITTTPSGGPQGEFSTNTPIYSTTLSATATSVTFSNIPTTYTDLVLVVNGSFSNTDYLNLQFNGDTSTSYSDLPFRGDGSSASAGAASSRAFIWTNTQANANSRFMCRSNIQNYSNPNINKSVLSRADSTTGFVAVNVGTWRKTEPITSIRVYALSGNNFNVGSTFTIYGIKAAAPAPKAIGGDTVTTDGSYWYHAFKNTGVFDAKQALTADIMVVAGGGGGGQYAPGGGGAGGFQLLTSQSLTAVKSVVTIGAGGTYGPGTDAGGNGFQGSNSQFGSLTASVGGGYGRGSNGAAGVGGNGGSGGGAGGTSGSAAGGSPTSGQGYAGGSVNSANYSGGGGGGAGGAGGSNSGATGGAGGIGAGGTGFTNYAIINAMAIATATGELSSSHYYYAGGGAGFSNTVGGGNSTNNIGGKGGGGGRTGNVNSDGTANTGGGASFGNSGGSGIVIVRYPV